MRSCYGSGPMIAKGELLPIIPRETFHLGGCSDKGGRAREHPSQHSVIGGETAEAIRVSGDLGYT